MDQIEICRFWDKQSAIQLRKSRVNPREWTPYCNLWGIDGFYLLILAFHINSSFIACNLLVAEANNSADWRFWGLFSIHAL